MNRQAPSTRAFFLLSFIPALAYWWLEENTTLEVALMGGTLLAVIELALERWLSGHLHALSKLNFVLIVGLGSIGLLAKEGLWFKLQPTLSGVVIGSWLTWRLSRGESLMLTMMKDMGRPWPFPELWLKQMETHLVGLVLFYAAFMAYWALSGTTGQWLFWKTGGQWVVFILFGAVEFLWLRHKIRRMNS